MLCRNSSPPCRGDDGSPAFSCSRQASIFRPGRWLPALPETVTATAASHVLTVMARVDQVPRPQSVLEANHLKVAVDDINEQMEGFVAPSEIHIEQVLNF